MPLNFTNWIKRVNFRLGIGGSAISLMEIPPAWNYAQYLRVYGEVGWLFGANNLISESVADVNWHLYKKDGNGKGDEVEGWHPLTDMWSFVNPFQTKYNFIQLLQMYIGLVGEAFIVLNFNGLGVPAEMWLAPPQFMAVIPHPQHYISHYEYRRYVGVLRLEVPEVIHIYNPNPLNPYRGLGTAHSIGVDLDSERNAANYQNRLFYNDATPGLMIEYPDIPEKTERDKIRAEWDEIHRGWRNARKTGFLWGGAKANTLALTNRDMEFWRLRKVNREVIIGAYRIPTSMLGLEGPGSRARVEADELVYSKYVVRPALTRIKEALNEQLIPLFDDNLIFDFEDPVPENREAVIDEVTKTYPVGIITREEARRKLGYDEKADKGETFVSPMNLIPETVKWQRHNELVRAFTDEQKEGRWRLYALKSEADERIFKRAFKRLWDKQADMVADAYERSGSLGFDSGEYDTAFTEGLRPVIEQVFTDAFDLAVSGGEVEPAHRSKQDALVNQAAVDWIATRSLRLARMVNGTSKEELRPILAEGLANGESVPQIKKRIKGYYENGYQRRATMVARTEVIAASNEGAIQGYEHEGIQKVEFYTSLDGRVDPDCEALHGTIYQISESHGVIPVHPDCRCTWIPVVD